jgi:hypothetical protein
MHVEYFAKRGIFRSRPRSKHDTNFGKLPGKTHMSNQYDWPAYSGMKPMSLRPMFQVDVAHLASRHFEIKLSHWLLRNSLAVTNLLRTVGFHALWNAMICLLVLSRTCTTFAGPPEFMSAPDFSCHSIATAVNYYVDLGERETLIELKALLEDRDPEKVTLGELHIQTRVGWICRILFMPKSDEPLRSPRWGSELLPWMSMPLSRWPMYPVAQSGVSFFVLAQARSLEGRPENMIEYLDYCSQFGRFRDKHVTVPNRSTAIADAVALRESNEWKTIKWIDRMGNSSYSFSEPHIHEFILSQAEVMRNDQ